MSKSKSFDTYQLINEIKSQLVVNNVQLSQLIDTKRVIRQRLYMFLIGIWILLTTIGVVIWFLLAGEKYFTFSFQELLPASLILLFFGLFQTIKNFIKFLSLQNALSLLIERQKQLIFVAEEKIEKTPY